MEYQKYDFTKHKITTKRHGDFNYIAVALAKRLHLYFLDNFQRGVSVELARIEDTLGLDILKSDYAHAASFREDTKNTKQLILLDNALTDLLVNLSFGGEGNFAKCSSNKPKKLSAIEQSILTKFNQVVVSEFEHALKAKYGFKFCELIQETDIGYIPGFNHHNKVINMVYDFTFGRQTGHLTVCLPRNIIDNSN